MATPKLVAAMLLLFAIAVFFWRTGGLPGRRVPDAARREFIAEYRLAHREAFKQEFQSGCGFGSPATPRAEETLPARCITAGMRGTWFVWGDSLAHAIAMGLRPELPPGISLTQISTGGCRPALPGEPAFSQSTELCRKSHAYAVKQIERLAPEIVIFVQRIGHQSVEWEKRAAELHRLGVRRVVVLGPLPRWTSPLSEIVAQNFWPAIPAFVTYGLDPEPAATDQLLLASLRDSTRVEYVSMIAQLCGPEGCRATVPGGAARELMVFDNAYLTMGGSRYVARTILIPRFNAEVDR